ncbi:MAG: non-hydrolyzing UDP-N-acetylglucosamine 2-epimerase [Oscillospiraceae bacterium]|jgi:UDP-N-acetylglucosamine 2-epimerase (non-hydrolysing)
MRKKIKVMSVFGTRPEAIKMAPLVLELQRRQEIESLVCVTAQHREMLDSVLDFFKITPEYDLNIMEHGQNLVDITTRAMDGLYRVYAEAKPDLVLVHGDTSSTFAGALAAFYAQIPVGHVEAGLRTYDRYSPYPEEMNRCLVARLAEYHFAPTAQNAENLRREGVTKGVFVTGNTVIDAMAYTVGGEREFSNPLLRQIDFAGRRVIAMTCHRRENYGAPMDSIFAAVRDIVQNFEDVEVVYPVHPSPVVQEAAERNLKGVPRVHLIEPLDAMEMHRLIDKSYMVMTDSGGLQEEAPALGKPVLVLRKETERPEAVMAGTVELAGVERGRIFKLASELLTDSEKYRRMARAVNPYGDGRACHRIADAILYSFGFSRRKPEDFAV